MASPRKAKIAFGPKVVPRRRGPQTGNPDVVADVANRVRQIRDRMADTDRKTGARLLMSARRFAAQIGITEQSFNLKVRKKNPTPFTPEELANICRVFCVRAEYLLLGDGPMLHEDVVEGGLANPSRFSTTLRAHLETVTALKLDQEVEWVQDHLPSAEVLMVAVESGVADGLAASVDALIQSQGASSAAIRSAIARRAQLEPPAGDAEGMSGIADAARRGEVIVLPRLADKEGR